LCNASEKALITNNDAQFATIHGVIVIKKMKKALFFYCIEAVDDDKIAPFLRKRKELIDESVC
jgi:hypothetical protein